MRILVGICVAGGLLTAAPAKDALSLLGRCADTVRLPLVPIADKPKAAVRDAMVHAGLIN